MPQWKHKTILPRENKILRSGRWKGFHVRTICGLLSFLGNEVHRMYRSRVFSLIIKPRFKS